MLFLLCCPNSFLQLFLVFCTRIQDLIEKDNEIERKSSIGFPCFFLLMIFKLRSLTLFAFFKMNYFSLQGEGKGRVPMLWFLGGKNKMSLSYSFQGLANYGPWTNPVLCFLKCVNGFYWNTAMLVPLYTVYSCFPTISELSRYNRDQMAYKDWNIFCFALFRRSLPILALECFKLLNMLEQNYSLNWVIHCFSKASCPFWYFQ